MPSVVQTTVINPSVGYMLKERPTEHVVSAFTAVNGKASPPSPHRTIGVNGMTIDSNHARPFSHTHLTHNQENRGSVPVRDNWTPAPRVQETGLPNGHHYSPAPVSPPLSSSSSEGSPRSPGKRKRSSSAEDDRSDHSPDVGFAQNRQRPDTYVSTATDSSPNTTSRQLMDAQQRTLPPLDRPEHERNWSTSDSQEVRHSTYSDQHYDPRNMQNTQDGADPNAPPGSQPNGLPNSEERSSTTEITRAGVQVDPKKRKRQFANRTKTGCGTCRRRKKKCDEAKPECNNCARGGFICEGYANKIPWPKNGITKPHPPIQAKSEFPAQLYHNHGGNRESYSEQPPQPAGEGGRGRPIVVEEHDRRNGWGQNWGEPPRSYPQEHHSLPAEYNHATSVPPQPRPSSNEAHIPHPTQGGQQRHHNPRIYHHTPQTMSHVVNNSPAGTDGPAQHQPQHLPQQQQPQVQPAPPTSAPAPPGPPPAHYAPPPPPKPQKSEKEKMLEGLPFLPYTQNLTEERARCKALCYQFNNTSNHQVAIANTERERHFRAILAAQWARHPHHHDQLGSSVGLQVSVDTPFTCDYGYNISIGDRVAIGTNCKFLDSARITIGRNTTIAANVTIDTIKIPTDHKSLKGTHGSAIAAEVVIGDNVYIGADSRIGAGVKIGTGAIIHPGSIVVRDVPRDVIVKGPTAEVRSVYFED